ncbi:hypothetical protein DP20_3786 [Shigella flexneri]|nr:hypothetical protein DP20_3786 [Shigella flexneri]
MCIAAAGVSVKPCQAKSCGLKVPECMSIYLPHFIAFSV